VPQATATVSSRADDSKTISSNGTCMAQYIGSIDKRVQDGSLALKHHWQYRAAAKCNINQAPRPAIPSQPLC